MSSNDLSNPYHSKTITENSTDQRLFLKQFSKVFQPSHNARLLNTVISMEKATTQQLTMSNGETQTRGPKKNQKSRNVLKFI